MPLPLNRNCVSDWVPAGIFNFVFLPSIVGTSMLSPNIAVVMEIGILQ